MSLKLSVGTLKTLLLTKCSEISLFPSFGMHILSVVMIRYVITDKAAVGSQGNDVIEIVPPLHTHTHTCRGKLDNLANGATAEDLSHTIGHPGGSCVQWKSVTFDLWCWKAVVDRYSIPVRALSVWPWLQGVCVSLRTGTIHIFSVDFKK